MAGHAFSIDGGAILGIDMSRILRRSQQQSQDVMATHAAKGSCLASRLTGELVSVVSKHDYATLQQQGALMLAPDDNWWARTKHIDLFHHFIAKAINAGEIAVS
jgi:hypothetical protein